MPARLEVASSCSCSYRGRRAWQLLGAKLLFFPRSGGFTVFSVFTHLVFEECVVVVVVVAVSGPVVRGVGVGEFGGSRLGRGLMAGEIARIGT